MKQLGDARSRLWVGSILVLLGCDGGALRVTTDVEITGLHFATSSAFPTNPSPTNVDVTLTDPTPSRAIYRATLALPAFQPHISCPVDLGYRHPLTFMSGQAVVLTATLNQGGCRDAIITGAPPERQTDDTYWALLAHDLGVEESALFSLGDP